MDLPRTYSQPVELTVFSQAIGFELARIEEPSRAGLRKPKDWIRCMKGKNFYFGATSAKGGVGAKKAEQLFGVDQSRNRRGASAKKPERKPHTNKWRHYKVGRYAPSLKTARAASKKAEVDLVYDLLHPIWDRRILDPNSRVANQISNLMGKYRFKVGLHSLCDHLNEWGPTGDRRFYKAFVKFLDKEMEDERPKEILVDGLCWTVSQGPSLKTLAGLTLVYRWAAGKCAVLYARSIVRVLYLQLVALGPELARRGICDLLYAYYLKYIFPLVREAAVAGTSHDMLRQSETLLAIATRGQPEDAQLEQSSLGDTLLATLAVCPLLEAAFRPKFVVNLGDQEPVPCFEQQVLDWFAAEHEHIDASVCVTVLHGPFPPADLFTRPLPVRNLSPAWLPNLVKAE